METSKGSGSLRYSRAIRGSSLWLWPVSAEAARAECGLSDLRASDFKHGGIGITVAKFIYPVQQEPCGLGKNPNLGEAG